MRISFNSACVYLGNADVVTLQDSLPFHATPAVVILVFLPLCNDIM